MDLNSQARVPSSKITCLHYCVASVPVRVKGSYSVQDVDDTAMGFRLLQLHGYDASPDVLGNFEKDGEFFCFVGQSNQVVTGMYNLNRASQVMFSGEHILDRAYKFSYRFLRLKQANNQLLNKWIITKDLPGEDGHRQEGHDCLFQRPPALYMPFRMPTVASTMSPSLTASAPKFLAILGYFFYESKW
ncbi:ent-copalyl diphosphate synthase 1, chloroplastic [Iris pallida]|uniref:Ent-copalyl diphosphate synthase 1, chloroplastic n=1 Tax=Iris pallida TaxID=29817 RepID=A0AAX6IJJ9_IRIPA|nr:ent-copalyl diphosphate synthase 1, chloroplastic [Iris pallida]